MTVLIKSKNKVPKTLQGFFNRAWRWAARPEFTHCTAWGTCNYRSPDGTNACFMGACIPDKLYKPSMEGLSASGLLHRLNATLDVDVNLLNHLQQCHDRPTRVGATQTSIKMLREFALAHKLKIPAIK
jgi:hypothetical protein